MTVVSMAAPSGLGDNLRQVMQAKVALPGDAACRSARRLRNGAVDSHLALVAIWETAEDAHAAVRAARAHGLLLSVRGAPVSHARHASILTTSSPRPRRCPDAAPWLGSLERRTI